MVRRGLRSLDELEESERQESEAVIAVQSSGGFGVIDWNAVLGDEVTDPVPSVLLGGSSDDIVAADLSRGSDA